MPKLYYKDPNIAGLHHKFDKELHAKYDIPAREKLKNILGDYLIENPDIYQQDFIINSNNCKYKFLEIQVCSKWDSKEFPFDKLYVFARKSKYDETTLYLLLNKFLTKGYIFSYNIFKNNIPRRLKKYSREYVYDIPKSDALFIYVEHLDKETFEFY